MDWDDVRAPSAKVITLGEPLGTFSITELEARAGALDAEIARIRAEVEAKRRQAAAAESLFRS